MLNIHLGLITRLYKYNCSIGLDFPDNGDTADDYALLADPFADDLAYIEDFTVAFDYLADMGGRYGDIFHYATPDRLSSIRYVA